MLDLQLVPASTTTKDNRANKESAALQTAGVARPSPPPTNQQELNTSKLVSGDAPTERLNDQQQQENKTGKRRHYRSGSHQWYQYQ
jgi:hypothetical protein